MSDTEHCWWVARDGDGEIAVILQKPQWLEVVDGWIGRGYLIVRDGNKWPQEKLANRTCRRLVMGPDVIHAPQVVDATPVLIEQSSDVETAS